MPLSNLLTLLPKTFSALPFYSPMAVANAAALSSLPILRLLPMSLLHLVPAAIGSNYDRPKAPVLAKMTGIRSTNCLCMSGTDANSVPSMTPGVAEAAQMATAAVLLFSFLLPLPITFASSIVPVVLLAPMFAEWPKAFWW